MLDRVRGGPQPIAFDCVFYDAPAVIRAELIRYTLPRARSHDASAALRAIPSKSTAAIKS